MDERRDVTVAQVEACLALCLATEALCDEAGEQRYEAVIVRAALVEACMKAVRRVREEWDW